MTSRPKTLVDILRNIADSGDATANLLLGYISEKQEEGQISKELAIEFYHRALSGNIPLAGYLIGRLEAARGNVDAANRHMVRAAEAGVARAALIVGAGYALNGEMTQKDLEAARFWLKKACELGEIDAYRPLGDLEVRYGNATNAREIFRQGGGAGCAECNVALARIVLESDDDKADAVALLTDAAGRGHPLAAHMLSAILRSGVSGVPPNPIAGTAYQALANVLLQREPKFPGTDK